MRTARIFPIAIFVVPFAFLTLTLTAQAQQSYVFTKVLDLSMQRPDGNGLFVITTITTPAFDGQWVVFRDNGSADDGSLQAIWSFNTKDATFHKLVDLHTVQPGGTATFTELHLLDTAPAVRNGTVVFLGRRASTAGLLEGIYAVPAAGGTVVMVADYTTADPSGGTFTLFDSSGVQIGGFGFDGTTVAFHGQGSAQTVGIYTAGANGTSSSLIADGSHPYAASGASVNTFSAPLVGGSNVVMAGTDGSDPSKGYNGLYLGKAGNNGSLTELLNSKQQLPGGTNASFHTRYDAPYMAFDGTTVVFHAADAAAPAASPLSGLYWTDLTSHAINKIVDVNSTLPGLAKLSNVGGQGVAASQGNVLFRAADNTAGKSGLYLWANGTAAPAASPLSGLYWTDLTSHAINKIADVNSTLPGLAKLSNVAGQGVAASQGNVLFRAADNTAGTSGLYLWANGTAARIVGTGDLLGGSAVQATHDPGPSALSGAGFAFLVEFGSTNSFAIYYATPVAGAGPVPSFNAASYASNGPLAANAIASAFGQGLADSAVAAGAPPLPATLGNTTLSVTDSAGTALGASLYYAGPTQINFVVPDGTATGAATVTVAKSGQTVATGTMQVAAVSPGLFTASGDGKGAAAAIALKAAASGAQTWQYTATCTAAGSCTTVPIDLGAATDQVYLELYGTGIRGSKTAITATIGGTSATPAFAVQPQYPGMDQVNLLIDRSLAGRGEVDVVLTVDGAAANTVKINVK